MIAAEVGAVAASAYPAMRELLRQCVAEAQADVAIVALPRVQEKGRGASLEIPAVFPPAERGLRQITRWVRQGVRQALETGRTEVMAGRTSSSGDHRRGTKFLVVAPLCSPNGKAWGAVAIVQSSSAIELAAINIVQQCAHTITATLAARDASYLYPEPMVPPPPPVRTRVHSGPRHDFLLHELRVPLSAATYALEALAQRHGQNWEYDDEHLLHTAQSGVHEAQKIVRAVSQWPALGEDMTKPQLAAVALDEMVARTLMLLPSARYKVVQKLDPDLPLVLGNESWITQVIMNLLENALKYSDEHSAVEVTAYRSTNDFVVLSVRSWGEAPRLDKGHQTRVDARRRFANEPTSKGLGLNIARYFVTSLGGEFTINGEGTEEFAVTVALPIASAREGQRIDDLN